MLADRSPGACPDESLGAAVHEGFDGRCRADPAELDMATALTDYVESEPAEDPADVLPAKRTEPTRHG